MSARSLVPTLAAIAVLAAVPALAQDPPAPAPQESAPVSSRQARPEAVERSRAGREDTSVTSPAPRGAGGDVTASQEASPESVRSWARPLRRPPKRANKAVVGVPARAVVAATVGAAVVAAR